MNFFWATFSIRRILYLVSLIGISFIVYHESHDINRIWATWAAFFLSLVVVEIPLRTSLKMMFFSGLGFILAAGFSGWLATFPLILPLGLGCITLSAVIFSQKQSQYYLSALVLTVFAIVSGLLIPTNVLNGKRIIWFAIGVIIVLGCKFLFYLIPSQGDSRRNIAMVFSNLLGLNQALFATLIDPAYQDNVYLFERRIHLKKIEYLQTFYAARKNFPVQENVLDRINLIFEKLLACSIVRFRIKDYAILKVCEAELVGILQTIDQIMMNWMNPSRRDTTCRSSGLPRSTLDNQKHFHALTHWIQRLDENYQHFLQAVAQDPLVFFLFVASLKSLVEELEKFNSI